MNRLLLQGVTRRILWVSLCVWVGLWGRANGAGLKDLGLLHEAQQSTWIAEGHGQKVIYVIFDPNCPYCHLVYTESQPYLKKYQFRWIPVAILTSTSAGKAAAMLEAHDRRAALAENEDHFVRARGKLGGLVPLLHVSDKTQLDLASNQALLLKTGMQVVPTILFLDTRGKVKIIKGAPAKSDFPAMLQEVASGSGVH